MINDLFYIAFNLSLAGSITAIAVILLRAVFKNSVRKAAFVFLWVIVFLRLLVPVSISSPTSIFNLFHQQSSSVQLVNGGLDIAPAFLKKSVHDKGTVNKSKNDLSAYDKNNTTKTSEPIKDTNAAQANHKLSVNTSVLALSNKEYTIVDIFTIVWVSGIVVLLVLGLIVYLMTTASMKGAVVLENALLTECKKVLHMKRNITLLKSNVAASPFVVGIINPKIVLPGSISLSESKSLTHILSHELVHIKRFDNLIKLFSSIVLCIHWYNPLVWVAYILLQRDLEASCDEKVLKVLGDSKKKEYATSLFEFASKRYSLSGAGFTSFGENSTKSRINNVLLYKKTSIPAVVITCLLIFSIVAGCATNPIQLTSGNTASFNGSKIVYAAEDGLYSATIGKGEAALLVKGTGISTPVFSNDGKSVAFQRGEDLFAYDFEADREQTLLKKVDFFCMGDGGAFYASSQKSGIIKVNPKTAKSETIVPAENDTSYLHLSISPDLKKLAYDTMIPGTINQGRDGTWVYDTGSKKTHMIAKSQKVDSTSLGSCPNVGKWFPDSNKILLWLMSQSASLSTDGVAPVVYDISTEKTIDLETTALAYNENISFASPSNFAVISGGSRMMFEGKHLSIFELSKGLSKQTLDVKGKVATTPCYSADGTRIIFAASPEAKENDDFENQMVTIDKRQIYMYMKGKLFTLTDDNRYRSEAPVFLKDNNYIIFARINAAGEKSIWVMDSDGKNQQSIAKWKYADPNDDRYLDFYGRANWNAMFDVFDNTETSGSSKTPNTQADSKAVDEADTKSNEAKDYKHIKDTEAAKPYIGLKGDDYRRAISLDELAERIAATYEFIEKYPSSPYKDEITKWKNEYQADYLFGNTKYDSSFKWYEGKDDFDENYLIDYEASIIKYKGTTFAKLMTEYLGLIRAENNKMTDKVRAFVKDHSKYEGVVFKFPIG